MRRITKEMIKIYGMSDIDWMGYKLENRQQFTYHHIVKKQYHGLDTISNGAILIGETSHNYIHVIESRELDMFVYLNRILKEINNSSKMPTKTELLKIYDCLLKFERDHCSDVNRFNEPLIKEDYTKRIIL
ncbi:MAG: hypothetical protein RSH78_01765 [Bacilli bacterium]